MEKVNVRKAAKVLEDIIKLSLDIERNTRCKFCNSRNIVRNGKRGGTQYWLCKNCGRGFVDNKALPKGRYSVKAVSSALYMYFTGSSLNDIRRYIEQQFNVGLPSDSAIYNWVVKFSEIASKEARKHKPTAIGDVWIADEIL